VINNAVTHPNLKAAYRNAQVIPRSRSGSGSVLRLEPGEGLPYIISRLTDEERTVFVMGFHGNFCVHSTIFGSPAQPAYIQGLLDYNKTVITSRSVLATEMQPLAPEFGPIAHL
jgi:hypothetical protein